MVMVKMVIVMMMMTVIMDLSNRSDSDRSCSRKSRGTHTPSCTGLQGTNIMAMIRWIMMIMIMRMMMGTSTHLYCRRARSSGYDSCRFRRRNQNFHDQNSREDNCWGAMMSFDMMRIQFCNINDHVQLTSRKRNQHTEIQIHLKICSFLSSQLSPVQPTLVRRK